MENILTTLFGYQRFAENPTLSRLIADTQSRYAVSAFSAGSAVSAASAAVPLSDAQVENLSAAAGRLYAPTTEGDDLISVTLKDPMGEGDL